MASQTLTEWAKLFLTTLSKYQAEIASFSKARSFDTRFGGRSRRQPTSVESARTNLIKVCEDLPNLLTNTSALASLSAIVEKIRNTNLNSDKIPSYYGELSKWYDTYIKPLL